MKEIINFEELILYGRNNGANIVNGMPWSFNYKGYPVTHENDECYLISSHKFTPQDLLITEHDGKTCIYKKVYLKKYELR